MIFNLVFPASKKSDTFNNDQEEDEDVVVVGPGTRSLKLTPLRKNMVQCRILLKIAHIANPVVYIMFCCIYFVYYTYFFKQ